MKAKPVFQTAAQSKQTKKTTLCVFMSQHIVTHSVSLISLDLRLTMIYSLSNICPDFFINALFLMSHQSQDQTPNRRTCVHAIYTQQSQLSG